MMKLFDHETLDVYQVAVELIACLFPITDGDQRREASVADQLRRASMSICLNIAEGSGEFSPKEKVRFYRYAKRSATECAAILDVIKVRATLACELHSIEATLSTGRELLHRVVSMLVKMVKRIE